MKRFCFAVTIITFILVTILPTAYTDDVDLDFIIAGIKYNNSLIENCGVKISYTVEITTYPEGYNANEKDMSSKYPEIPPGPFLQEIKKERYEYDCVLKGEKEKVEEKWYEYISQDGQDSPILNQHLLWTYDGEKIRRIFYPAKYVGGPDVGSDIRRFRWKVPLLFGSKGVLSSKSNYQLVGKDQIDGHDCYLIERNYKHDEASRTTKMWIAPEMGFRLLKDELCSENVEGILEHIEKTDYEEHNRIWAIKHQTYQNFFKTKSEKIRFNDRELTVNKIEFICPPEEEIPDSVFVLQFPKEIKKIWDADREIYIDNPLSEEGEEDITEDTTAQELH